MNMIYPLAICAIVLIVCGLALEIATAVLRRKIWWELVKARSCEVCANSGKPHCRSCRKSKNKPFFKAGRR